MFGQTQAFSGFAVDDLDAARRFYGETLGLRVEESGQGEMRMLILALGSGARVFVYPKQAHTPATFTLPNFPVDDIESAVGELERRAASQEEHGGVRFFFLHELGEDEECEAVAGADGERRTYKERVSEPGILEAVFGLVGGVEPEEDVIAFHRGVDVCGYAVEAEASCRISEFAAEA